MQDNYPTPSSAVVLYDPPPAFLPAPDHPPRQAGTDADVTRLWLHGKAAHTRRAYRHDIGRFQAFVGKPLAAVTLGDLQAFCDSFTGLADSSRGRAVAAAKSLLSFGCKIGYLRFNVGAAVSAPRTKCALTERILSEGDVQRMLALEPDARNAAILRLLYCAGLRVAELHGVKWKDCTPRGDAGQVVVFGKGSKTRSVLLSAATWETVSGLQGNSGPGEPVFRSRKGSPLSCCQILRIVRAAAQRAGIPARVSPHWLRHAHASHSLERGAPISLVQATLGHSSVATTGRYLHARPNDSSGRYLAV